MRNASDWAKGIYEEKKKNKKGRKLDLVLLKRQSPECTWQRPTPTPWPIPPGLASVLKACMWPLLSLDSSPPDSHSPNSHSPSVSDRNFTSQSFPEPAPHLKWQSPEQPCTHTLLCLLYLQSTFHQSTFYLLFFLLSAYSPAN